MVWLGFEAGTAGLKAQTNPLCLSNTTFNLSNWIKIRGSGCGSVGRVVASNAEVRSSNPIIGKIVMNIVYCQLYRKDENKEKEAGNGPFLYAANGQST